MFQGRNINRLVQNAKIQQQIAGLRVDSLKLELTADLEQAFANYSNALDLLSLDEANVSIALQTVQIAKDRYQIGVTTPLEYREAQRNLINLQSRIIEARFAALQASIDLYRLSGQDITLSR
ncbi:MAG: hypothetical protein DDT31_01922 [Syntrophomonadaceae bacterium]|nr:hypothetical protein [Bacillota bacterium]